MFQQFLEGKTKGKGGLKHQKKTSHQNYSQGQAFKFPKFCESFRNCSIGLLVLAPAASSPKLELEGASVGGRS
jgi:hypothetical protein